MIVTIFNHPNHPKFLSLGAGNGSLSAIVDLVCLCLAAAPGYISSRSFHPPSTSSNYCISFAYSFSTLFPLHFLSLSHRGFEFSSSPVALAAIPSSAKALEVCCLSNVLHNSTITIQLGSFTLSPFTYLLLTLDSSGILLTFAINYNPLLYKAPSKFILSSPPFILQFFTQLSTLHTTLHTTVDSSHTCRLINSINYRLVKLRRHYNKCFRLLTTRHPITEVALRSV